LGVHDLVEEVALPRSEDLDRRLPCDLGKEAIVLSGHDDGYARHKVVPPRVSLEDLRVERHLLGNDCVTLDSRSALVDTVLMEHHGNGLPLRVGLERQLRVDDLVEEVSLRFRVDIVDCLSGELNEEAAAFARHSKEHGGRQLIAADVTIEDRGVERDCGPRLRLCQRA